MLFRSAIKRRRRGRVIRLEMEEGIDPALESVLKEELGGSEAILTETGGFLGIGDLARLVDEDRPDLKFPPFSPRFPERIREYGGDPRTSSSTTRTRASTSSSPSWGRRRRTRTWWRSSRRSIARASRAR